MVARARQDRALGPAQLTSFHVDRHPLLGERLGDENVLFETLLTIEQFPYLADHRVFDRVVLPTTAALESAVAAAVQALGFSRPIVSDFFYELALAVPLDQPVWMHLGISPDGSGMTFRVESTGIDDGDPSTFRQRYRSERYRQSRSRHFPSQELRSCHEIPPDRFYRFRDQGLSCGRHFEALSASGVTTTFAKVARCAGARGGLPAASGVPRRVPSCVGPPFESMGRSSRRNMRIVYV
jgi:acyl transferase domain-containing protein